MSRFEPLLDTLPREGPWLLEDGGLELAAALGLDVPPHAVLPGTATTAGTGGDGVAEAVAAVAGERVAVKVLSQSMPHRAAAGGLAIVPRDRWAVGEVIRRWTASGLLRPALDRVLVQAFVDPGREPLDVLVGFRTTPAFGAVISVGPGGGLAEAWAGALGAGQGPVHFTPGLWRDEAVRTAILTGLAGRVFLRGISDAHRAHRLTRLLDGLVELARAGPPRGLAEFEVNPVRWTAAGPLALDALGRWGAPVSPAGGGGRELDVLFRPRTLALVGVSATAANPGRIMLRNTLAAGFPPERIRVVKEGVESLEGVACVPSVAALEEPVDLMVVGVPANRVAEVVAEAAARGRARGYVVISGGLEEGAAPEAAEGIRRALEDGGGGTRATPLVGTNCLGIRSVPGALDTLFIPREKLGFPDRPADPVALVSQSGAFAIARASCTPNLNPRYVVTLGTQLDVTVGQVLEWLVDDPQLHTAACYVEGFRPGDGTRVLEAARAWRAAGRRVLLYVGGRSEAGLASAASHTAALAGDHQLTQQLAAHAGVVVAPTVEDFQDQLLLHSLLGPPPGGPGPLRLAGISNAGFECVAMGDHGAGVQWPGFGPDTLEGLRSILASARLDGVVQPQNPLDVTPILGDEGFTAAARLVLGDGGVDAAVVSCVPLTPALRTLPGEEMDSGGALAPRLAALRADGPAEGWPPWVAAVDAGPAYAPFRELLMQAGIPVFPTADRAVRALVRWAGGGG